MRGDESRVVEAFCQHLVDHGWQVRREVGFCDVVAQRGSETLYAEAKGRTSEPGLDVDTLYGQLLRRMPIGEDMSARFAVVVPASAKVAALRVPASVRALLRVDVYTVGDEGHVSQVE